MELCHLQWIPSNLVTLHGDECMARTNTAHIKTSNHQIYIFGNKLFHTSLTLALMISEASVETSVKVSDLILVTDVPFPNILPSALCVPIQNIIIVLLM